MTLPAPRNSIELLRELLAFPSVTLTPNAGLIQRVRDLLAEAGISSRVVADPQDSSRCNLFASVGPRDVPASCFRAIPTSSPWPDSPGPWSLSRPRNATA